MSAADESPAPQSWRTEQSSRVAVIVDAEAYFAAARSAMLQARERVLLIGWDFDARVDLGESAEAPEAPRAVGAFILWLVRRNPKLEVHLLRWDIGAMKALFRGTTILTVAKMILHPRIHTKLDGCHPTAASHHQKIVIVDDCVAFCGGIDMTGDRWDTRAHRPGDPRRVKPNGKPYKPWHDAISAVEGPAARALGDLFRDRWKIATGVRLAPTEIESACWPKALEPDFCDVPVAISRTAPAYGGREEVREIEANTLALIARARRRLYIESQYFASRSVAEAIGRRLAEPDPPEIVLINPLTAQGWLEPIAMDSARARLFEALRRLDRHGRFRIYHPYTAEGEPIYVHAKILIVDEAVIRVGSSNLNNRSMGLDTECDVTIDADALGDADAQARIRAIRDDLIAEHLGRPVEVVSAAIEANGSLIEAIESLRDDGRSLRPYEMPDVEGVTRWLAENEVLDPEAPGEMFEALNERKLVSRLRRWRGRRRG